MITDNDADLISVDEFARAWRIDSSLVRWWINKGWVDYVMVGAHMMVRKSSIIKPIEPTELRTELIELFVKSGAAPTPEEAATIVDSIDNTLWREMADNLKEQP